MMTPDAFARPNAALLALRPVVPAEPAAPATVGAFLHTTLRPVLKLQNNLLLAVVADFVRDHHIAPRPTEEQKLLSELLSRNTKLRYTVVGLLTGAFTADEYTFYRQHRPELNRRLLEMAQRRVLDQAATVWGLAG